MVNLRHEKVKGQAWQAKQVFSLWSMFSASSTWPTTFWVSRCVSGSIQEEAAPGTYSESQPRQCSALSQTQASSCSKGQTTLSYWDHLNPWPDQNLSNSCCSVQQTEQAPAWDAALLIFLQVQKSNSNICSLGLLAPCIDISDAFRYHCVCATSREFIFPLFAKINSIPSMKGGRRQGWFKWFHFAIFCVLFKSLIHFSAQYSALSLIRKSLICSEKCKSESCLRALLGICKCVGFCVASKLFLKGFWCLQLASLAPVDPSPSPRSTPVCRAVQCIPSASKKLFLLYSQYSH